MLPGTLPIWGRAPFSLACCMDHSLCVAPAAHPSCQVVLGNFARTEEPGRRGSAPDAIRVPGPGRGAIQRRGDLCERWSATVAPCSHLAHGLLPAPPE